MIFEKLFDFMFSILERLLSFLPDVEWSSANVSLSNVLDIVESICYFLPMKTVCSIITLIIAFYIFRAMVALLKTILQCIPFV